VFLKKMNFILKIQILIISHTGELGWNKQSLNERKHLGDWVRAFTVGQRLSNISQILNDFNNIDVSGGGFGDDDSSSNH